MCLLTVPLPVFLGCASSGSAWNHSEMLLHGIQANVITYSVTTSAFDCASGGRAGN